MATSSTSPRAPAWRTMLPWTQAQEPGASSPSGQLVPQRLPRPNHRHPAAITTRETPASESRRARSAWGSTPATVLVRAITPRSTRVEGPATRRYW